MQRLHGVVQRYAWGDLEFIPDLLGVDPDGQPWAELWFGTHPNGPAHLDDGRLLVEASGELPYLLKVLAAAQPLSLQTHPNREQAIDGHARGQLPDPNPKPELLCALTRFEAFCGIRPVDATLELLAVVGADDLAGSLRRDGVDGALAGLFCGDCDPMPTIEACVRTISDRPEAAWVRRLAATYPGEPSVAATLLLNLVVLEPGECLRLDPGNLHGYLSGAGIELMGNSDNVIRGGLTVKPVDVGELLAVVDTTPLTEPVLARSETYDLPAAGVSLLRLDAGDEHTSTGREIAVDLAGQAWYLATGDTLTASTTTYVVVGAD
jgi:mannose-6-phosphate isomerase